MKVYFSCSITGGRNDQPVYAAMVNWMVSHGHEVLTAHLANPGVTIEEETVGPEEVFRRDIAWVDAASVVVAEVSTPSHGVGYEIAYAIVTGKPVLCLAREEVKVSKMITGNPKLTFARYESADEAVKEIERFLR
ncbi:MAG: nucleoside 2-deoxyribosyltransferase [Verrucomicrobia bacterium]|nr:nucleoside 2-deoxyribosyltransferase [Verrucomicrobiota bacterium]